MSTTHRDDLAAHGTARRSGDLRVALVHDYLTQPGGAERVVAEWIKRWPEAELHTLVHDPDGTFDEFRRADVRTSALQPLADKLSHRLLLPLLPFGVRSLDLRGLAVDAVLSSSSGWAHGVRTPAGVPHVCYCHNPPRWLYDTDRYLDGRTTLGGALRPVLGALRRWDQTAATRPTHYVANSRNVAARIEKVYGRTAEVVHPPVGIERFQPTPLRPDGYLLVLSRLLRYKRVDLAIEAGRLAGVRVVIAGNGPERERLEALADATVEFRGRVEDEDLPALFDGAAAFFLGGEEDFGITPLEANASGRPVVAYGAGGALETVRDGETGLLFDAQTPQSAAAALRRIPAIQWQPERLAAHAAQWAPEHFIRRLEDILERAVAEMRSAEQLRERVA